MVENRPIRFTYQNAYVCFLPLLPSREIGKIVYNSLSFDPSGPIPKEEVKSQPDVLREARQRLETSDLPVDEQGRILDMIASLISSMDSSTIQDSNFLTLLIETFANHGNLLMIIERQAAELDALKRITFNLTSNLDLKSVLDAVVSEALHLVADAQESHIHLYDKDKLIFGASLDKNGVKDRQMSIPRPEGLTRTVATQKQVMIVEDMHTHPLFIRAPKPRTGSIIGIPLKFNDTIVGVMNLSKTTRGGFSASELRLLGLLADQAAVAISNASLHQTVSRQAYSDMVTGLPNRRALDERLEEEVIKARRTGNTFAVIMLDVDGFKAVNDTHGHLSGSRMLVEVARVLRSCVRDDDVLVRYGGDEYVVLLVGIDSGGGLKVAERIRRAVEDHRFLSREGARVRVTASIGLASYPEHAQDKSEILDLADRAMYRGKRSSRNVVYIASHDLPPVPAGDRT